MGSCGDSPYNKVITQAALTSDQITYVELHCASSGLADCVNMKIEGPFLGAGAISAVDIPTEVAHRLVLWMQGQE